MNIKRLFGILLSASLMTSVMFGSTQSVNGQPKLFSQNTAATISSAAETRLISQAPTDGFTLPPLPYGYDALDQYIDQQTMMLHHDKHHAGYVNNLNDAIAKHPDFKGQSIEALLQDLENIPEDIRTTVRNNGGGHANHSMFWEIISNPANHP